MGIPEIPKNAKLVAAITFKESEQLAAAEEFLTDRFGQTDFRSDILPFTYTGYYEEEMGPGLLKIFISFERLVKREILPSVKLDTNKYEQATAKDGRRTVNIDPGYICEASLVLATTKNFSHRIYLDSGIYGDCHLIFEEDEFRPMPWTYPDYKDPKVLTFLKETRTKYYEQLHSEKPHKGVTYKDAGVDIAEGDRALDRIKQMVKRTFGKNVLTELGKFGGFYAPDWGEMREPVLVASVDGVGTKLVIAYKTGVHNTVGSCLVNHCVNDVLCCGAKPLFFLDYLAFGKLDSQVFEDIVSGFAGACERAGCALIGGETAEMPGIYNEGEYDISGTIVGITDKSKIIDGSKINPGDVIIGLPSTGLHTNGYSLARKIFFDSAGLTVDTQLPELDGTVGEELLKIHRCYLHDIYPFIENEIVHGLAHITGGGMLGNINRLLRPGIKADIDWSSWDWLPVFTVMQRLGNVSTEEMRHVFNLGIGLVIITSEKHADTITGSFNDSGTEYRIVGKIVEEKNS